MHAGSSIPKRDHERAKAERRERKTRLRGMSWQERVAERTREERQP